MGTARSVLFTVFSIIMIAAGAIGMIAAAFFVAERIHFPETILLLTLAIAALQVIGALFNLITGISNVRKYNKRTNSEVVITLPKLTIVLSVIAMILSCINGIMLSSLIVLLITGVLIPLLFIYSAVRKSYS